MKITLKLFVSLAQYLPGTAVRNIAEIDVASDATVHQVIDAYHVPRPAAHLILINGVYVLPQDRDQPIFHAGDVLAIWPPVAGG